MALDQRQQMVDQRRRQVGCYWKQRTTGSYDDEIRRRRPEQRLAPMGGAADMFCRTKPKHCRKTQKMQGLRQSTYADELLWETAAAHAELGCGVRHFQDAVRALRYGFPTLRYGFPTIWFVFDVYVRASWCRLCKDQTDQDRNLTAKHAMMPVSGRCGSVHLQAQIPLLPEEQRYRGLALGTYPACVGHMRTYPSRPFPTGLMGVMES